MANIVFLVNRSTGADAGTMPAGLFYSLDKKWQRIFVISNSIEEPPEVVELRERLKTRRPDTLAKRK